VPPNWSQSVSNRLTLFLAGVISSVLKMETTRSSETSMYNEPTWRYIPEDGILHISRSTDGTKKVNLSLGVIN
jgi:hypothetical protein